MASVTHVAASIVVDVPQTPWWLTMLQIFVPVATALLAAVVAYRFSLRGDREARFTEARLQVQRQALEATQNALADYWFWGQKALRARNLDDPDVVSGLEKASTALTVTHSRLQDRNLAESVLAWHTNVTVRIGAVAGSKTSYEEARRVISDENDEFNALCNALGNSLRDLSATPAEIVIRESPPIKV